LPIVIDFGADACIPCKAMAQVLKKLNEELASKAIVVFVDVWKYKELAANYPVEVIPTQILIDVKGNPYTPSENKTVEFIQYTYRETGKVAFTAHQGGLTEEQLIKVIKEMGVKEL
jgi:thioredoxin 1